MAHFLTRFAEIYTVKIVKLYTHTPHIARATCAFFSLGECVFIKNLAGVCMCAKG